MPAVAAAQDDAPRLRTREEFQGRAERPTDAEDVLLWIPRVVTGPLYLITEYLIRVPLGALVTEVERNQIVHAIFSVLLFGPNRNAGVIPTAFFDFGFLPSVGLYAFWNEFLVPENRISVHAATWGPDWLQFTAGDRVAFSPVTAAFVRGRYLRRPDFALGSAVFFPGTDERLRYQSNSALGELGFELRTPRRGRSFFRASTMVQWATFSDTVWRDDPGVVPFAEQNGASLPPAFTSGYAAASLFVRGAIDTRDRDGLPSTGFRLFAGGQAFSAWAGVPGSRWFRVTGQALGSVDVDSRRAITLTFDVGAILPVGDAIVPFDQAIDLGGQNSMPAFIPGVLRGYTAVATTLAYEWPVWVFLVARLHVGYGNVFGFDFADFGIDRGRFSFGLGMRAVGQGEAPFEVGIGLGTDPLDAGASVSNFRFYVGARADL